MLGLKWTHATNATKAAESDTFTFIIRIPDFNGPYQNLGKPPKHSGTKQAVLYLIRRTGHLLQTLIFSDHLFARCISDTFVYI